MRRPKLNQYSEVTGCKTLKIHHFDVCMARVRFGIVLISTRFHASPEDFQNWTVQSFFHHDFCASIMGEKAKKNVFVGFNCTSTCYSHLILKSDRMLYVLPVSYMCMLLLGRF